MLFFPRVDCRINPIFFARSSFPLAENRVIFFLALALSLSLHLIASLALLSALQKNKAEPPNEPQPIQAQLEILPPKPEPPPVANPRLKLKPSRKKPISQSSPQSFQSKTAPKSKAEPEKSLNRLAAIAKQKFEEMEKSGEFYPIEAIRQRQQGTVGVQLFFDEKGNVIAVRLAESSGYPLLDAAATRASRSLQSLPADGLETVILPVVFRLEKIP